MNLYEVKDRNAALLDSLLKIWEPSVRATHLFLSESEIQRIKAYVPLALKGVVHLVIAEERTDHDEEGGPYPLLYMNLSDRL